MSALEKFQKLGYKRKQNNKYKIKYLKIDKNYWGELTKKGTEVYFWISFNKENKIVTLESIYYSLNVENKRIQNNMHFNLNKDLLDAISEQLSELE